MTEVSLSELYARDPRENTDEDLARLIASLREARSKFVTAGKGGRSPGTAPKLTEAQKAATSAIDLTAIKL